MRWLKQLFTRRTLYRDLSEEIQQHVDEKTVALMAQGMDREAAAQEARRVFGNVALLEERSREAWQWLTVESLWADLRGAVRQIRKRPAMAIIVVLTFGIGIGASTATFSVANAFLFTPLGLPHSDQLMVVQQQRGGYDASTPYADFAQLQEQNKSFTEMAAHAEAHLDLTGSGEPQRMSAERVSTNFFHLLGVEAGQGRSFAPQESIPGNEREVVLSYALWQHHFGASAAILGQQISLDGQAYTVIGVMPKNFHFPLSVDMWVPLSLTPAEQNDRTLRDLSVLGRLKPGVSPQQAQSEAQALAARLSREYPATNTAVTVKMLPLAIALNSELTSAYMRMMLGSTFFVMLVVCANVANLSLARVLARSQELAVRVTLGAMRARIVRQLLTESALLGLLGAAAGIAFAAIDLHFVLISMPPEVSRYVYHWDQIGLNLPVLAAAILVAIASGLAAGLVPALLVTRKSSSSAGMASLSASRTTTDSRQTHRLRNIFAVVQVALALVLVSGAALLVQGMHTMISKEPVSSPKSMLTFSIDLPASRYATERQRQAFYAEALPRLRQIPGISDAGMAGTFPYTNGDAAWREFSVEDQPKTPGSPRASETMPISPGYLNLMNIGIVTGRGLSASDSADAPAVVLVNQRFAQTIWPKQQPIGQHLRLDSWSQNAQWATVIGVVSNVSYNWTDQSDQPAIYYAAAQHPPEQTYFALRTTGDALALAPAARKALQSIDADLPLDEVKTYDRFLHESFIGLIYVVVMMAGMGGITLLLGALGIYGVLASGVQERTREIGVRMALGASRADIRRRTLYSGARLFAVGALIGLPCAQLLAYLLAGLFYGVHTTDLGTLFGTILLAGAMAVLASWLPAMRAASIDPMRALRGE